MVRIRSKTSRTFKSLPKRTYSPKTPPLLTSWIPPNLLFYTVGSSKTPQVTASASHALTCCVMSYAPRGLGVQRFLFKQTGPTSSWTFGGHSTFWERIVSTITNLSGTLCSNSVPFPSCSRSQNARPPSDAFFSAQKTPLLPCFRCALPAPHLFSFFLLCQPACNTSPSLEASP